MVNIKKIFSKTIFFLLIILLTGGCSKRLINSLSLEISAEQRFKQLVFFYQKENIKKVRNYIGEDLLKEIEEKIKYEFINYDEIKIKYDIIGVTTLTATDEIRLKVGWFIEKIESASGHYIEDGNVVELVFTRDKRDLRITDINGNFLGITKN